MSIFENPNPLFNDATVEQSISTLLEVTLKNLKSRGENPAFSFRDTVCFAENDAGIILLEVALQQAQMFCHLDKALIYYAGLVKPKFADREFVANTCNKVLAAFCAKHKLISAQPILSTDPVLG